MKFWKCFATRLAPWLSLTSKYRFCTLVTEEALKNSIFSMFKCVGAFSEILCDSVKDNQEIQMHITHNIIV